ncbi:MAG: SDR family NAD(P)-dependent oxidoreductase [Geminicoccaceae bacterium]|nr:SDR family oxidoreductase [Geminicoccaceae bacterium]MCS7268494.1 SDR family oxidoreductase [Geminicoccaceae bacterium]MCX8102486.1 SDR family oxidoreductase [Geminicoccaceae bacterium]MDW8124384.1 SDR family NAD(P)-dependent oxidoreductase [Geminicoccaceae bacterium]MDW8340844.1 SDR family NAD(P)-dependent oxidoreductase [Geminicoccaceae bacterium]
MSMAKMSTPNAFTPGPESGKAAWRLDGEVALVTGAGAGVGRGIAHALAEAGAAVLVTDIDLASARRVAEELAAKGARAASFPFDVRDPDQAEAACAAAVELLGGLDIAVANAGSTARMPFLEMSPSFFEEQLRLNLLGTFLTCRAAAKTMIARGTRGRIVTISSNSGRFGGRGRAAYSASKAGIIALTQTMAIELAPYGILVNCVAPGPIRTEKVTAERPSEAFTCRMALPRFGEPIEVGRAVVFLASEACSFTTGHTLGVDGGLTVTGIMEG